MAGSIIKRGKNIYLVRLYLGLENGKRKYHNKTIHGTKKDAERYLNKILRDRDLDEFIEPSNEVLKLYLERWLETSAKPSLAPSTYINYEKMVSIYIEPNLGNVKLSKLNALDIQEFYNTLSRSGLAPKTVKNIHGVLNRALNKATEWGLIRKNPIKGVDLPKQRKREMKVLNPEQAALFIDASAYSPYKALFSLLLSTGLRPGEALGLKWGDIDFKKKRLHVQRSLFKNGSSWSLNDPKTPQSRRSIPLPRSVIEDLEEHRDSQNEIKQESKQYNDNDLVFAGKSGDPLDYKSIYHRHFKPILRNAGLPDITLYGLRHTCSTLLLSYGVNPKVVSERLGHSSIKITLDCYSHVLPDMQDQATDKLEKILFNNR